VTSSRTGWNIGSRRNILELLAHRGNNKGLAWLARSVISHGTA
jgi:hypothetical protein